MLHPKLGTPVREGVGGGAAIIPSAKKRGGPAPERNPALGSNIEAGIEVPAEPAVAEVSPEPAVDEEADSSDDPSDDSIPDV